MVKGIMCANKSSDNKSKKKDPTYLQNLYCYFRKFCDCSSIHGLKYLGEKRRPVLERIWWLIIIAACLYFCIILIQNVHQKWKTSPVIVTFAKTQTPIFDIPFPSVTICPEIKTIKTAYNFTNEILKMRNNSNITDETISSEFNYVSLVCPGFLKLREFESTVEDINETALMFLLKVAPDFRDIVSQCRWSGEDCSNVDTFFTKSITTEGICYSFNLLDIHDIVTEEVNYLNFSTSKAEEPKWSMDEGYKTTNLETFPRRTSIAGVRGGLDLILMTDENDLDYLCGDSVHGYKIMLQQPGQIPIPNQPYFRVPLDQDVVGIIKPNKMTTSEALRNYEPNDRECYFNGDRSLRFFKIYSQQNCIFECLTNFTYEFCDCVSFYMPHNNNTPICGPGADYCVEYAHEFFLVDEVSFKLEMETKKTRKSKKESLPTGQCNCLPSCNSLDFDLETSQSDWDWRPVYNFYSDSKNETGSYHFSRLRLFFKKMQFITSERNELYGNTDFLANCGGLLGLFTGFSIISLLEIVYFLSLRCVCNIYKYGWCYWSGAEELIETNDTKATLTPKINHIEFA